MRSCAIILLTLLFPAAFAQIDPINKEGVAVGGYDVVEYFKSNSAVKGRQDISLEWSKVRYWFSSEANKELFQSNPANYLPQYDGYCALAVGTTGRKISIDPKTFRIANGKLYLFFNGKSFSGTTFNSLEPWIKDEQKLIRKADEMWPTVKTKKYKGESQ
jgi:hypothetical protein